MKSKQISLLFALFSIVMLGIAQNAVPDFNSLLEYRNMGPHRTGAWISSLAVPQTSDTAFKNTYYVAGRYGGVWKTVNAGTTFFPVFDQVGVSSIGAVAVSSTDPNQVWVGSGEAYNARSSHAGNGVYKSTDGGENWESLGLEDTQHISTLIIHPENPNIAWVAAMGHLFTPNKMRGVFKTSDGGKTWKKTLFIDENTGIIDLIINPQNPDILYAAAYEKYRFPWHYEAGGKQSGIYKSSDGGDHWEKLSNGLPGGKIGRIGLALVYHQPDIVYAVVENLNPKPGVVIDENVAMDNMRDPYFDQMIGGEIYRSDNDGKTWEKTNTGDCNVSGKAAYSFNKIMVLPDKPDHIFVSSDALLYSTDGGKTWPNCKWGTGDLFPNMFGDIRTFWADPNDSKHLMIGSDGGLYESFDGGKTVRHESQIPLGEIYIVETDDEDPYNVYVGMQDHDAWKAPSNSWAGQISSDDWKIVGLWDGMYTRVDPVDNRWVYLTTQFGAHHREDQQAGERVNIQPKSADAKNPYRFPWTPALEISPFHHKTIYTGGQMLLKSVDQGDHWEEISPDLTTNNAEKIAGKGHMMYCTITTISASPVQEDLIWVGTDDGRVHMTKDGGKHWEEMTEKIAALGGPADYWVPRIVASPHHAGTAYVVKSGFRNDDFQPLVFKTIDFGKSWKKITSGISIAPVNVIIEDPSSPDLLYLGNDNGVYYSMNGGETWQSLSLNMPVVQVNDLKVQKREHDLVVGTYGRGAYLTDIYLLQQLMGFDFSKPSLFAVESKLKSNYSERAFWGNYELSGNTHITTPNEPNALVVYYYLAQNSDSSPKLKVFDSSDKLIEEFELENTKGIHKILIPNQNKEAGNYKLVMHVGSQEFKQEAIIKPTPQWSVGPQIIHPIK